MTAVAAPAMSSSTEAHPTMLDAVNKMFTVEKAKLASLALLGLLSIFHAYRLATIDSQNLIEVYPGEDKLNFMTTDEIRSCFKSKTFAFIGDSRIRQKYQTVVKMLNPSFNPQTDMAWHQDHDFTDESSGALFWFRWRPFPSQEMVEAFEKLTAAKVQFVLSGSATHNIKFSGGKDEGLTEYRQGLALLKPTLEKLPSRLVWQLQEDVIENLLNENRTMITNYWIDRYNEAVESIFGSSTNIEIWRSNRQVESSNKDLKGDGIHLSAKALEIDVQLLFNSFCKESPPASRKMEPISFWQYFIGICYLSAIIGALIWPFLNRRSSPPSPRDDEEALVESLPKKAPPKASWLEEFLVSFARFGAVMLYMYVCDRTNFFEREAKQRNLFNLFFLPLTGVTILGLYYSDKLEARQAAFLNRFQTEEWKGWMQLAILFYHISGASSVIPIYTGVRFLVSAYIFLNGYAHATFLLSGGAFGLQRLTKQLFRLNFLTLMMCLTMNRPYMLYYFVPLITFWFLTMSLVFLIPPRPVIKGPEKPAPQPPPKETEGVEVASKPLPVAPQYLNGPIWNIVVRLAVLFFVICFLNFSETVFDFIFSIPPFRFLFVTSDDSMHEWRFRWQVDRFSALAGASFGLLLAVLRQRNLMFDTSDWWSSRPRYTQIIAVLSALCIFGFGMFAFFCTGKQTCNSIHPWIVGFVVISYIMLRNLNVLVRSRYSTFMAWFGHISLELFLAQYHIWLANDTKGILVLVPGLPVINVIVISFVFVCASHELSKGTAKLADLLIPEAVSRLVTGLVGFFAILLISGNLHRMFTW